MKIAEILAAWASLGLALGFLISSLIIFIDKIFKKKIFKKNFFNLIFIFFILFYFLKQNFNLSILLTFCFFIGLIIPKFLITSD